MNELKNTLKYIHSELMRLETMAGTLSTVENDHFKRLTNFDHRELTDIAVEEQSAARQLSNMKQMCLTMAQKVEEIQKDFDNGTVGESSDHVQVH